MLLEMRLLLEASAARAAFEGSLVGVSSQMNLQIRFTFFGEPLAAHRASQDFIGDVSILRPKGSRW